MSVCEEEPTFPSTRFIGSKTKIIQWIWKTMKNLDFQSCLDAFGGTASISYKMKKKGKLVFYNDILRFNYNIGLALIENDSFRISQEEFDQVVSKEEFKYKDVIQSTFRSIYFTDEENEWLDIVVTNIHRTKHKYKKAMLLSALYQACLIKRPFNLFHRCNLNLRMNNVKRTFRNKALWDAPFHVHFQKFIKEYNNAIFSNGLRNKALCMDVFKLPQDFDLVYLDPPYFSNGKGGVNYLNMYHFLEGMTDYDGWPKQIDFHVKNRRLKSVPEIGVWSRKSNIVKLFDRLIKKFRKSIIVLSYRNDGYPSKEKIVELITKYKRRKPSVCSLAHKYALSRNNSHELLFIAE